MPVRFVTGDIFDAPTQTIVNTVNTRGVMGKGLALAFRRRPEFRSMYEEYQELCAAGRVRVGEPYLHKQSRPWVLNFPTKDDWRRPSRLEWIRLGLEYFVQHYKDWGIESIAFPQLGTQNGGLPWDQVRAVMNEALDPLDIEVLIYTYQPEPSAARPNAASTRSRRSQRVVAAAEDTAGTLSRTKRTRRRRSSGVEARPRTNSVVGRQQPLPGIDGENAVDRR